MNDQYVRNVIEAALLAAGRPLAADELVTLFDERDGSSAAEVHAAIDFLRTEYATRGLELVEVASGFRIQIRAGVAQPVSRLWQERPAKYSRALLETLALVAYRQPITRGEIEHIRGVAVNPNIIKTLLERSWIRVVGHRDVPGKPELLGTTRDFLNYFSLQKLDDLPTLAELKELQDLRVQLTLPGAAPAAPEGAASEGAASEGAAPEGVAPKGAAADGAAADGAASEGAADATPGDPSLHPRSDGEASAGAPPEGPAGGSAPDRAALHEGARATVAAADGDAGAHGVTELSAVTAARAVRSAATLAAAADEDEYRDEDQDQDQDQDEARHPGIAEEPQQRVSGRVVLGAAEDQR